MKAELQQKLYEKYPKIFVQKDLEPARTSMCFGIATGDGWYNIIDRLCNDIQKYIDKNKIDQVEAMQVKEKFGGLRFYVSGAPKEIYDYIYNAEEESLKTCETCGSKNNITQTKGWITTICKKCLEKIKKEGN